MTSYNRTVAYQEGMQWGICTPNPKLLRTRFNGVKTFHLEKININMAFQPNFYNCTPSGQISGYATATEKYKRTNILRSF